MPSSSRGYWHCILLYPTILSCFVMQIASNNIVRCSTNNLKNAAVFLFSFINRKFCILKFYSFLITVSWTTNHVIITDELPISTCEFTGNNQISGIRCAIFLALSFADIKSVKPISLNLLKLTSKCISFTDQTCFNPKSTRYSSSLLICRINI